MLENPVLDYSIRELSSFRRNYYTVRSVGSSTALAGQSTTFSLPSAGLISWAETSILGDFVATVTGNPGSPDNYVRMPANLATGLVRRIQLVSGGITLVEQSNQYNQYLTLREALNNAFCEASSTKQLLERQFMPRDRDQFENALGADDNERATGSPTTGSRQYAIQMETLMPNLSANVWDLSIFPSIQIIVDWASNDVLSRSANVDTITNFATDPTTLRPVQWQVDNLTLEVCTYSVSGNAYSIALQNYLRGDNFVEILYDRVVSFLNSSHTGSTTFQVASQSVDKIFAQPKKSDWLGQVAPHAFPCTASKANNMQNTANVGEMWQAKNLVGEFPTGLVDYQYSIAGAVFPNSRSNLTNACKNWLDCADTDTPAPSVFSRAAFEDGSGALCMRFTPRMSRAMGKIYRAGMNTLGSSLVSRIETTGGGSVPMLVHVVCRSGIRVGSNLQVATVS